MGQGGGGSMGPGGGGGFAQQAGGGAGLQMGGGGGGGAGGNGGAWVSESSGLAAAMPVMSEHSRASRPLKRSAAPELGGGGGGGNAYGEVPRSLSHPPLGRGGGGGAGGGGGGGGGPFPHLDLQQQLNSLQAQVRREGAGGRRAVPERSDERFAGAVGSQGGQVRWRLRRCSLVRCGVVLGVPAAPDLAGWLAGCLVGCLAGGG
jgi:hypothetical protein